MEKQANAVERASQALQTSSNAQQRSEAERVLISLCKSPKPYSLCLYILTKSQQPLAQFQALKAIYEAMLREWGEIGGAQRQQLREILLQFATSRKLEAFVANKLAQVAAVLFKREWLEKEKPLIAAVELRIMKLASAPNNILALSLATVFAKALLAEFSCDQSSSLGLPCSFHVRCHRSFEKSVLLPVFTLMVRILSTQTKALSSHADTSNQPILRERIHIISSCLAVMHSVLSWEFEESASNEALVMRLQANSDSSPASSSSFVRPGPKWKTILLDSNLLPTLLQIYPVLRRFMKGLRGRHGFGGFDVLRNLRQTFLQLMSLRGSIFSDQSTAPPTSPPSRQQLNGFGINPRTKLGYLSQLVKACSSLTQCAGCGGSVDSVDEDEISELCDMYQRLCKTFGVMWIFRLSFLESSSLMQNLTRLTCWLCSGYFGSLLDDTVSTWASEAFDVLCHTWVTLISQLVEDEHSLVKGKQGAPPVSPEVIKGALQLVTKCSGEVFPQYLERRLFLARKEATEALQASRQGAEFKEQHEQFSDSSYLDDELECLGLVARLNARVNLGHLVQVTKARVQSLRKFAELELQGGRGGGASPNSNVVHCSVSHEELIWLVRLLGYMLADTEEGETPLIPNTIMQLARQGPDSSKLSGMDLIVQAVESVLLLAELENKLLEFSVKNNRGSKSESLSPLVATHVVQFLRRWSASYLMPFESYYSLIAPGIWQSFGQGTPTSVRILHAIVQKLCSNLAYWSEEEDLVEATSLLLKTLVKSEKVRRSLPLTPAWNGVVAAYQKSVLITHLQTKQPATFIKGPIMESMVHTMGQCSVFSSQAATPSSNQIKFSQVVQPINRRLQFFLQSVSNPENEKVRLSIRFRKELVEILHMLRGVASLRGAQAYPEAFAFLSGALKHLIELLSLYHPFHGVVTLTLQLFQDIAESGELMYLDPPPSETVYAKSACACGPVL